MFDNLRRQSLEPSFADADEEAFMDEAPEATAESAAPGRRSALNLSGMLRGLEPWQWFVLTLLLFLNVSLLACGALIVFEVIDITRLLP